MTQTTFQVDSRAEKKPKYLRREGIVPGNIFGGGDSIAIQMGVREFGRLHKDVGETGLVYLQVGQGKTQHPVLIDEVQVDPVSNELIHVAFKKVDLTDTIEAMVPVEIVGKFELPEAVMVVVKDEIEVEALPTDLPEKFEIDVSILKAIGQVIAYKDLQFDRTKVKLVLGKDGEEEPIVLVQEQREEEVEEVVVAEPVEGEAVAAEGESAEGEEGKTGEEKPAGEKSADDKAKPNEKAADKKPEAQKDKA